ncbi:MAG: response regulator [Alkalispirochaetaceae bacterium]
MKVLIADDSTLLRRNLRRLLSTIPSVSELCESDTVASTIEAIENQSPDTVILDLLLPDGTGFDVLTYLRDQRRSIRVIVLTTFPGSSERHRALSLGAEQFLDKSKEYERLFDLLGE